MIGAFEIEEEERDIDELFVAQVNGSTFLNSTRQIYGRDDEFPYYLTRNEGIRRGHQLLDDPGLFGRGRR